LDLSLGVRGLAKKSLSVLLGLLELLANPGFGELFFLLLLSLFLFLSLALGLFPLSLKD